MRFGAENKLAPARFVSFFKLLVGDYIPARRKVGAFYNLHHLA